MMNVQNLYRDANDCVVLSVDEVEILIEFVIRDVGDDLLREAVDDKHVDVGPYHTNDKNTLIIIIIIIIMLSGDDREHLFLFQRISVAIQRFNTVLLHDGFPSEDHPD